MKKIKNPVTVLDHLTNRMIDDHNMKEKEQPKDESKEDEFIEFDVPIKTPLWEDDESKEVSHFEFDENGDNIIVTESKEVKEGGELFTGGEWEVGPNGNIEALIGIDALDTPPPLIAWINKQVSESEANAALIAQSKNMYYAINKLLRILECERASNGVSLCIRYQTEYELAKGIVNKATPKK